MAPFGMERHVCILAVTRGRWKLREGERQIRGGAVLRAAPSGENASPTLS